MNLKQGEKTTIDLNRLPSNTFAQSSEQKKLYALISRRHPKYKALLPHWAFMKSTYEGGRTWFEENLFRYIKEGEEEFADRKKRAYRFNHTREVVDLVNKYLFKQAIMRNQIDAPDCIVEFWKKSTRSGLTIKDFARQVSKKTSQLGRIGIVVDTTFAGEKAVVTKADEKQADIHSYCYIVEPQQLLDYSYDEDGALQWVLIHEIGRDDQDPFTSSGKEVNRFRLWTKQSWSLYEIREQARGGKLEIKKVEEGEHGLGEVPVILADNIIGDEEYSAPALIDDIAYLDRATANYLSNLDAIIQDQTFSQLAMPAQNLMPGEDGYNKLLEMGTKRVFLYDGEGGSVPAYISPDVKQADLIIAAVNKIIGEIYHTVGMAGERTKQDNAVGIDNSSGVAKAYDFERVNALLAAKADALEAIENKIVRLVAKWHGVEVSDKEYFVSYPDNFDTRGLYDEFDISARLMLIEAPDEVRRAQMEMVIDKLFPQLAKDLKAKMIDELKDWPVDPIELARRIADKSGQGDLVGSSSVTKTPADDAKPASKAKTEAKATKDNRQGQVTKQTK